MKKNSKKFMPLLLAFSIIVCSGSAISNANVKTPDLSISDSAMLQDIDVENLIKSSKSFSEKEKQQLLKEYDKIKDINKKIDKILDEENKIRTKILAKEHAVFDEYDKISSANQKLWDKLNNDISSSQLSYDEKKLVMDSKVLTKEEKNILLKDIQSLDKLDKKIDIIYKKIEKSTKHLRKKEASLSEEIYKIYTENSLWDKVYPDKIAY